MDAFMDQLTPIIVQVMMLVVTTVIGAIGFAARKWINTKFNKEQLEVINDIALVGVQAAEQLFKHFDGEAKKQFALEYAEAELAKRGINVDLDELSTIIEAAVLAEFNYPASVEPATPPTETVVSMGSVEAPKE